MKRSISLLLVWISVGVVLGAEPQARLSECTDVIVENEVFRFVIGADARAKSLVVKSTGEECLASGVRMPIASLVQDRAYDNEYKLMMPAKPWRHAANRVARAGDLLKIGFEDEFNVALVRLDVRSDYVGFKLERMAYDFEDFGDKRMTEVDELTILQLPLRARTHMGRTLNCLWDDRTAVALLAGNVATRVDAERTGDEAWTLTAGSEERVDLSAAHAVLVATAQPSFLDAVDHVERDLGLPRGVASRRRSDYACSYYFITDFSSATVDRHLDLAHQMGFGAVMADLDTLTCSVGSYAYRPTALRNDAELVEIGRKVRAAGFHFGLHIYPSKVSTNDPLLCSRTPDPRFATICELFFAEPVDAMATTLVMTGNPHLLRTEKNRGLLWADGELILYSGLEPSAPGRPFKLTGCHRGHLGSPTRPHARLALARHLDVDDWVRFVRLDQESTIQDEVAERLAHFWKVGGFDFCYWDGAEDVPKPFWHYVPRAQLTVYTHLEPRPVFSETALKSHFGWHMMSRGNAFDVFPPERLRAAFKKYVLRTARQDADDFSCVNFGWLRMRLPTKTPPVFKERTGMTGQFRRDLTVDKGIGMQPDMFEFVESKALAWNCPISLQMSIKEMAHPRLADNVAVIRAWENARRAGAFTPAERELLKDPDREFFLWPFGNEGERPEFVEWKCLTAAEERPWRAFSYERAGRSGLVVWNVFEPGQPDLQLPGASARTVDGRLFLESAEPRTELERRFREFSTRCASSR